MSSVASTSTAAITHRAAHDPHSYRMTLGEHLEELRRRIIFGLIGFAVVAGVCLYYGTRLESYFCQPLVDALSAADVNPQVFE